MENRTDAKKDAVLSLTEQVLKEAVDEFKGMKVNFAGGDYDSVDIFLGQSKRTVRIAYDSPLAIFKDIASAIPY